MLKNTITLMTGYLKSKNYDIEFNNDEVTIVKHNDDPWNRFNRFTAKVDGIYNYVEVQMGGYAEKKRVSCISFEISCFLALSFFVLQEQLQNEEKILMSEIKKHTDFVVKNSTDYWRGQFIIDELISLTK